jgi:AcrR family transcriptional regulator
MDFDSRSMRAKQKLQTRAEIVRVAFDLFGKHGFEEVSVETIAAATGISRGTFFNYFPKKELILREVAASRLEKLKSNLARLTAEEEHPGFESVLDLVLSIVEENARISLQSKKLLLETIFHQASQGLLLAARDQAIKALAEAIGRIPRQRQGDEMAVAGALFSVYVGTMLEWLMIEGVPREWLKETMRERLVVVWEGAA